jgi:hypothetical protein
MIAFGFMAAKRFVAAAAIALGLGCGSSIALAQNNTREILSIGTLVDRIKQAESQSDVIAMYADAVGRAGDDVSVQRAYVNRMAELEAPEAAETQARELTQRTHDGLPWAIVALMSARQGDLNSALVQLGSGVQFAPNNTFVQKAAAQLLAHFDADVDPDAVPAEVRQAADRIRRTIGNNSTYVNAYEHAMAEMTPAGDSAELPAGPMLMFISGDSGVDRTPSVRWPGGLHHEDYYDFGYVLAAYQYGIPQIIPDYIGVEWGRYAVGFNAPLYYVGGFRYRPVNPWALPVYTRVGIVNRSPGFFPYAYGYGYGYGGSYNNFHGWPGRYPFTTSLVPHNFPNNYSGPAFGYYPGPGINYRPGGYYPPGSIYGSPNRMLPTRSRDTFYLNQPIYR